MAATAAAMIDLLPADPKAALELVGRAATMAKTLKDMAGAVPPGGRRRRWRGHEERERAYLAFQHAALELAAWAARLQVLRLAGPRRTNGAMFVLAGFMQEVVKARAQNRSLLDAVANEGSFRSLGTLALAAEQVERAYVGILVQELVQFSAATTAFLAALTQVRLVGNPGLREIAENITALTGELLSRAPGGNPTWWQRMTVCALGRDADLEKAAIAFDDCRLAFGDAHRDFTIAARQDLGYDAPRRWWHRLQWWRRTTDSWPGDWPGPDPEELINRAREQRQLPKQVAGSARHA